MSAPHDPSPPTTTRSEAIANFLNGENVAYEMLEHEPTMRAAAEAQATDYPPEQVAKTIVLHERGAYVIVAIPSSERLDLHKLRALLGASRRLQLADEEQIGKDFPSLEVGAVPPFGPMTPAAEVIDHRLLDQPWVLCPAGDHRHSVVVDPHDVVRITAARTGDICQD